MSTDKRAGIVAYEYILEAARQERAEGDFTHVLQLADLGIRVEVRRFGVVSSKLVSWVELETCRVNPLKAMRRLILRKMSS